LVGGSPRLTGPQTCAAKKGRKCSAQHQAEWKEPCTKTSGALPLLLMPGAAGVKRPERRDSKGFGLLLLLLLCAAAGGAVAGPALRTSMARPVGSSTTERVTPLSAPAAVDMRSRRAWPLWERGGHGGGGGAGRWEAPNTTLECKGLKPWTRGRRRRRRRRRRKRRRLCAGCIVCGVYVCVYACDGVIKYHGTDERRVCRRSPRGFFPLHNCCYEPRRTRFHEPQPAKARSLLCVKFCSAVYRNAWGLAGQSGRLECVWVLGVWHCDTIDEHTSVVERAARLRVSSRLERTPEDTPHTHTHASSCGLHFLVDFSWLVSHRESRLSSPDSRTQFTALV
jgi:hypothetical protein